MNKKRILITGGQSNEYIDEVMKITKPSTRKLPRLLVQMNCQIFQQDARF